MLLLFPFVSIVLARLASPKSALVAIMPWHIVVYVLLGFIGDLVVGDPFSAVKGGFTVYNVLKR